MDAQRAPQQHEIEGEDVSRADRILLIAWAVVSVTSYGMCRLGGKQCGQGAKVRPVEAAEGGG